MSDVNANIRVNVDTATAQKQLAALQAQVQGMGRATSGSQIFDSKSVMKEIPKIEDRFAVMQRRIDKNMLGIRKSFRMGMREVVGFRTTFGRTFKEQEKMFDLAGARAQKFQQALAKVEKQGIKLDPETMRVFNQQADVLNQRLQLMYKNLDNAATGLINWGKNVQWAGRQLMIGLTLPLTLFGAAAAAVFKDLDREIVNFKRVYGDLGTSAAETDKITESVKELSVELTKYGQSVQQTLQLSGDIAATGAVGDELISRTVATTKLATLGMIDQQQAMDATISMQSAFAMSNEELAQSVDFLNAVENQTVLSLSDVTEAIPRAATVIRGLGGDIKDMAVLLTAMREGGVQAVDGANALKSGLARLITPTKNASEAAAAYGINLQKMIDANRGDLMGLLDDFGAALNQLDDFGKQEVLSKVFGKYQFARFSALFNSLSDDASQAQRALDLVGMSAQELAQLSDKELGAVSDSIGVKFTASVERLKASLAPIGEQVLKIVTPIVDFAGKLLAAFDKLPDGAQIVTILGAAFAALVGPVVMFIGLMGNFVGNLLKGTLQLSKFFVTMRQGAGATQYMTEETQDLLIKEALLQTTMDAVTAAAMRQDAAFEAAAASAGRLATSIGRLGSTGGAMPGQMTLPMKFASGGRVPGSGNQDSVPALLTPGEFVVNKGAAAGNGSFLKALNNGSVERLVKGSQDFVGGFEDKVRARTSGQHTNRVMNVMKDLFERAVLDALVSAGEQGAEAMAQKLEEEMDKVIASADAKGEELRQRNITSEVGDPNSLRNRVGYAGQTEGLHLAHDRPGLFERGALPGHVPGSRGALMDTPAMNSILQQIEDTGGKLATGGEERLTVMTEFNSLLQQVNKTLGLTDNQFGIFGEALSNSVLNLPADVNRLAASGNITGNQALAKIESENVGWRQGTSTLRQQMYDAQPADMTADERAEYRQAVDQYAEDYWNGMIEQMRQAGDNIIDDPAMDAMAATARSEAQGKIQKHADHIKQQHDLLGDQVAEVDGSLQYFDQATRKWLNQKDAMAKYVQDVANGLKSKGIDIDATGITRIDDLAELLGTEIQRLEGEGKEVSQELQTTYDQLKRVSLEGAGGVINVGGISSSIKALDASERKPTTAANYQTYRTGTIGPAADAAMKSAGVKSSKAGKEAAMKFIESYMQMLETGLNMDEALVKELAEITGVFREMGEEGGHAFLQGLDTSTGIASPSKEMHQRGVDLHRGLAQGLEESRPLAVGEAAETADAIKAEIMGANPTGTGYAMPTGVGSIYMGKAAGAPEVDKKAEREFKKVNKNYMRSITRATYAMTGLTTVTALLPSKFQETAQKLTSASFALTGFIGMLDLLDENGPIVSGINKAVGGLQDKLVGGAKAAGNSLMVPIQGVGNAFKKFKSKLGPVGTLLDSFGQMLKKLTRGKGLLALISLALAAGTGVFQMKKFNDSLGDLAKAAKVTADEFKSLGEILGFEQKQFGRNSQVAGTSEEEVALGVRAREAAQSDPARVKRIQEASSGQAAAALQSLYVDMIANGADQETAGAFVEAVAAEAGKAEIFIPYNIDFDEDGNIKNFDDILKNSLVPSLKQFDETVANINANGGVFNDQAVQNLGWFRQLINEVPEGMQDMIPGFDKINDSLSEAGKEGRAAASAISSLYNIASSQFTTTGNIEAFNQQMAGIRQELENMSTPQALYAVKAQLTDMYPAAKQGVETITDLNTAIGLSQIAAQGYNVSGIIQNFYELGSSAAEAAAQVNYLNSLLYGDYQTGSGKSDGIFDLQEKVAGAQQAVAEAEAYQSKVVAGRKAQKDAKKNGGSGGSKDPFAAEENRLRDELAEIEIKDIEIDEGAKKRFRDDLNERLKDDPIEMPLDIDGEAIEVKNVADAQYAIEQIGEEIEELEDKMKPFEEQIEAIEDNIEPAQVRLDSINGIIDDQKDKIEEVNEKYDDLLKPLEDQRKSVEGIIDALEEQRDVAAAPFDDRIKQLEDTLKMEEYAADKQSEALDEQKDGLEDQKELIDDRIQALEKTAQINEYIAKQQGNQLSLADALSRGDIGAAAQAQAKAQADAAQQASDMQKERLDESKDGIDSEIDLLDQQQEMIDKRLDALKKEIDEQEYQKWLVTKTYDDQIDAQQKVLKGIDQQSKKLEDQRDAAIAPFQEIIDSYAPEIRDLENFIRDNEAEINRIRREGIDPLQDQIDKRQEDADLLEDIISDSESYTNRLKAQNQQKRDAIALDQRRLAAEKELANLSSGGGGGGGGTKYSKADEDAANAALEKAKADLAAFEEELAKLQNEVQEALVPPPEMESWWQTALGYVQGFVDGVLGALGAMEEFIVRVGKTIAAVFLAIFGPTIRRQIGLLVEKVKGFIDKVKAGWEAMREAARIALAWIEENFPEVFAAIETAVEAVKTVINSIKTVFKGAIDFMKAVWNRWWDWSGPGKSVLDMETDIRDLFKTHFVSALEEAVAPIGEAWDNIVETIMSPLRDILDWLKTNFMGEQSIWKKIAAAISKVDPGKKLVESLQPAVTLVNNVVDKLIELKNNMGGVISAGAKWVTSKIPVIGKNDGGLIPGTGNKDTVPAMLTPGEFVIKKSSAQALGMPMLNALNDGKFPVAQSSPTAGSGIMGSITNNVSNNYNNVNVNAGSANAGEVADIVVRRLARLNQQNIGGN
jgi:TP901 family phage tail tape measure protein